MNDMDSIAIRLAKLERQNLRMKLAGTALIMVSAAVVFMGQGRTPDRPGQGRVVEAERFVLREPDGYVRGEWAVLPNGSTLLSMFDRDHNTRAEWGVFPSGTTMLHLLDAKGKGRLTLTVKKDGKPMLGLYDEEGRIRARWGVFATGKTAALMFDKQGNAAWTAP